MSAIQKPHKSKMSLMQKRRGWGGGQGGQLPPPPRVGFSENFGNLRSVRPFGENMECYRLLCRAVVKLI